ncbi:MAG: histidinol-phosphate transaminase [Oscillospiraceae bacterium]|nr:histidinol-phosphate transaminase [Oscillospiraceae bacterium]
MSRFINNRLKDFKAYIPGEQPTDLEYIKLNTNESPYPPSPGVIKAINEGEINKLNLYPNPDAKKLIRKIAEFYDVSPNNVVVGNGSDELLAFAFFAFFEKGVCFPDITYGFYPVYAELYNVPYSLIPLRDDLSVGVSDYVGIGKNIVIANPNAPTGTTLEPFDIEEIVKSNPDHLVLVDEAYIDFGGVSAIPLTKKYDNLLVIHTYSKARSMAGARLAYGVANEALISDLKMMKYSFNPYNVNRLTQEAGFAALEEADYYRKNNNEIIKTREYTRECLLELGFEMTSSKANFLFAKFRGINGEDLYLKLKDKGILVRHWDKPRISDYVRISIGTREQMEKLVEAIKEILGGA